MTRKIKALAFSLSLLLAVSLFAMPATVWAEPAASDDPILDVAAKDDDSYLEYYDRYSKQEKYYGFLSAEMTSSQTAETVTVDGKSGVKLENGSDEWVEFTVTAPKTAVYGIKIGYYAPQSQTGKDIVLSLELDGAAPYEKAKTLSLSRTWADTVQEDGTTVKRDAQGNDLRPAQKEVLLWNEALFINEQGLYDEPYILYLSEGEHKIRLSVRDESIIVGGLSLGFEEKAKSYKDYLSQYGGADYAKGEATVLQAEQAYRKSDAMLYPTYDRTTPNVYPYDAAGVRLNTIGKENWAQNGQWISWEVPVKEAGLYNLAFHANQDFSQSMNSYRTLYVNGEIPFKEAENIAFRYDTSWYMKVLGDDKPMYVYLKPGDVISLSCVPGELASVLRNIQQSVLGLNSLYRDIIAITSTSPDMYQDYNLDVKLPHLEQTLKDNKKLLEETYGEVKKVLGTSGGNASTLQQVAQILGELAFDPYSIPERLGTFKSEIENLGSLILSLQSQPLELDFIAFVPKGAEVPDGKVSFIESLKYGFMKFFYSFVTDYNNLSGGGASAKTVNVWVSTGRDQLQIINNMITDSFTVNTGTNIKLSLIDTGVTMIQATLAGKGPDVALTVGKDLPVNLAMRGALVDLSKYDFSTLRSQTSESAWTSFYYNGGLYALPEGETFHVLFYRTDIFEELGLSGPPDTWDEFYDQMEIIQKNNFDVGILETDSANYGVSAGIDIFSSFLFQNGGKYYNEGLNHTLFESEVAYTAFKQWVNLYDTFGLDRSFSFYNLFRSGEMPMGIVGYGSYNQLMAAAPEITGLWKFAPIPGTLKEDGSVDRSQPTAVTGSIVLKAAEKHGVLNEAVEFITWWTSAETQARYCQELEATMGVAARGAPANHVALQKLGWNAEELAVLKECYTWTQNMEQVPGNYVVTRSLTSAVRAAIEGEQTIRRSLILYNIDINNEIKRKRAEFNLD